MSYTYFAFFMGLFGSIHCAVMCGPLLLAVQGKQNMTWIAVLNKLLYQSGRIMTYGILGLILGLIGNTAEIQGWQQGLSLMTGILLLFIALIHFTGSKNSSFAKWQTRAVQPIVRLFSKWLFKPGGSFFAGILNGLLPCGMVYMALASAMNAGSIRESILFMVMFGLGTIPLLFAFSFVGNFSSKIRFSFSKWVPALYIMMGIWFILRGANLDIPYLSPLIHVKGAANCL